MPVLVHHDEIVKVPTGRLAIHRGGLCFSLISDLQTRLPDVFLFFESDMRQTFQGTDKEMETCPLHVRCQQLYDNLCL